jgi:FtsP/CotA-like multicopper oxidase with cupredoxin domain
MLVSRRTNGLNQLWRGGPAYDREYVLLYEDSDSRAMPLTTPSGPPRLPYEPNYFTLNGLSFPERASDADSRVAATLGERVLIRFGNLGRMRQSIHFHGFHVQIVARDNVPETALPPKDTIPVPHATTVDVILTPHQRGLYPLHPHSLTAVTDNGNYPAGQLTFTEVT